MRLEVRPCVDICANEGREQICARKLSLSLYILSFADKMGESLRQPHVTRQFACGRHRLIPLVRHRCVRAHVCACVHGFLLVLVCMFIPSHLGVLVCLYFCVIFCSCVCAWVFSCARDSVCFCMYVCAHVYVRACVHVCDCFLLCAHSNSSHIHLVFHSHTSSPLTDECSCLQESCALES